MARMQSLTVTDHVHCNGGTDRPYMYRRLSGIGHDPEEFTDFCGPRGVEKLRPHSWQPSAGDVPQYDGADMPSIDLPEDHQAPEPQPPPLDVSRLTKIEGYESVGYHANSSAPPIAPPKEEQEEQPRPEEEYSRVAHIDEEQAKKAFMREVSKHCCWGTKVARTMHVLKIIPSSALHYTLETYTEERSTSWEHEPYHVGGIIDGPVNGPPPGPWDIHCNPTQTFHNEVHFLEVPKTSSVTPCHGCGAMGWMRCHMCMGRGFKRCITCLGQGRFWKADSHGHRHMVSCWHCHGTGRKKCMSCGGDGRIQCRTCQGFRQIKCFIKLKVEYIAHQLEHIVEHTDMPEQLVKHVAGEIVFEQTQPSVWPISNYPVQDVCLASQRLMHDHNSQFQGKAKIIMQRHKLRAVPVSECTYTWKSDDSDDDDERRFWVYGKENACYAPDYPMKYCWGCQIL